MAVPNELTAPANVDALRTVLLGRNDPANYVSVGVGSGVGLALWNTRFMMGGGFDSPGWLIFTALVAPIVFTAWSRGGLLACLWFPFPSVLVGFLHYYLDGPGQIVVISLPRIVVFAAVTAMTLGTVGYVLGAGGRWGYERVGPEKRPKLPS